MLDRQNLFTSTGESAIFRPFVSKYRFKAYLGMTAATLLWASNTVAVKFAVQEIPPFALTSLRVTLAAAALAVAHALTGGRFHLRPGEKGSLLKLSLSGVALILIGLGIARQGWLTSA